MKIYFCMNLFKPIPLLIILISLISSRGNYLFADYQFEELRIDSSTKTEGDGPAIPTNPFEIVEMIRRYNSLNDATNPADAIDEALNSFNNPDKE